MTYSIKATLLGISVLMLAGCNGGDNKTNIEVIQNMMDQVSVKSQDWVPAEGDRVQMRMPPDHTVPRNMVLYAYAKDPQGAERQPNPFSKDMSPELLTLGGKVYGIYCAVCHGADGSGNGIVAAKMAVKPRNLITAEAKAYTDGRIYHAITAGMGVMGAYGGQIPDVKARWAVVNYVRSLQK